MTHVGERRLEQYVLDELDGPRRDAVDQHLAGCAACRERLAAERRLDEALVLAVGAPPADAAERGLERLWATLDAAPTGTGPWPSERSAPVERSGRPRRLGWARPWLSVAALLLVSAALVLQQAGEDGAPVVDEGHPGVTAQRAPQAGADGSDAAEATLDDGASPVAHTPRAGPETPTTGGGDDPAAVSPPPPAPAVLPGASLDPLRLAGLRAQLAADLLSLELDAELAGDGLLATVEPVLAPLRRQGWPVSGLLRGLALEGDDDVAPLALRLAHADPALAPALAAALDLRPATVLDLLERDARPLAHSTALLRELERLADPRQPDGSHTARAQLLLAGGADARCRSATARLLERAAGVASAAPDDCAALLRLGRAAPLDLALAALLQAGDRLALRAACREVFRERVTAAPGQALPLLVERLEDRHQVDPLLSFCVGTGLDGLAAPLLARLEHDPDDDGVLATLVDLGGLEVALGLQRAEADADERAARRLSAALALVFDAEPGLLEVVADELAGQGSEALVALAETLPTGRRGVLLRRGLRHWRHDVGGHGAALLTALARLGDASDGAALRADLDLFAGGELAPLAWTAAARLDRDATLQAYAAAGGDPQRLASVARQSTRRLAAGRRPPASALDPLARELARLAAR